MRIIHLLNHTRRLNGHVHAAVDLSCAQREDGHAVAIASGGGDFDGLLDERGVERFAIDHTRRPASLVASMSKLHKLVRTWRPDVVHGHMMTSALLAWPVAKVSGIPLVTTVHNEFEKSAILMGLGTRVIAVSDVVCASMRRRGIPHSRLSVVLNGTIGSARKPRQHGPAVELSRPAILFVGGLHPRKGLGDLIRAFDLVHARHPAARLYIVGDGPCRHQYETMAAALGCGTAISFAGAQSDPFAWMRGADIFVLPSLADPAPLVIPEAREAGCAVVATCVDGIPQLLEHGEAGLLVPPNDPSALATELIGLLDDHAKLADLRRRSQLRLDKLTIARVASETLDVYAQAIAKRSPWSSPLKSHAR
jgi:glycosyltransferase involved in cell wall biosynthesis